MTNWDKNYNWFKLNSAQGHIQKMMSILWKGRRKQRRGKQVRGMILKDIRKRRNWWKFQWVVQRVKGAKKNKRKSKVKMSLTWRTSLESRKGSTKKIQLENSSLMDLLNRCLTYLDQHWKWSHHPRMMRPHSCLNLMLTNKWKSSQRKGKSRRSLQLGHHPILNLAESISKTSLLMLYPL